MSNFFVLGLPRSRTAWLANFLTYGNHFCYHEGINGCSTISEYKNKLGHNGDSGTGLMLFDLETLFPDSPKVIIESDPEKTIKFAEKTYGICDHEFVYDLRDELNKVAGLRVKYEDINANLKNIWEYLIGSGFNKTRAEMLIKLNIQVTDPYDCDQQAMRNILNDR